MEKKNSKKNSIQISRLLSSKTKTKTQVFLFAVYCSLLLYAATAKSLQSCPTLCDPIDGSPARLLRPWDSPGKNTGVGCHCIATSSLLIRERKCLKAQRLVLGPSRTTCILK